MAIVNDMPAIKYIVGKGLKYKDFNMTPALILTIREGYLGAMKYLLSKGAKIPNIEFHTPDKEIYNYLKAQGVNIFYDPNKEPLTFEET